MMMWWVRSLFFLCCLQGGLLGQNQLVLYSDESEMFRLMTPLEVKTAKYHNLIHIKALPFQEFKISLFISSAVIDKKVKLLKDHLTYYALSKEDGKYRLRYRGSLPVEIPIPIYLKNRNHKWQITYRKDQFIELEELIPDPIAAPLTDTLNQKSSRQKKDETLPLSAEKGLNIDEPTTPKAILDLIRISHPTALKDISDEEFLQKMDLLRKTKTDSEKLILGKNLFHNTSLQIPQIIEVCNIFTHDFSKADFSIYAYATCQDPENYQELLKVVHFELIKVLLNRETSTKNQNDRKTL